MCLQLQIDLTYSNFWNKGFYLNLRFFLYSELTIRDLITLVFGLSLRILNQVHLLQETRRHTSTILTSTKSLDNCFRPYLLKQVVAYVSSAYPPLNTMRLLFHWNNTRKYLTRSYAGLRLYMNKPIKGQRTRSNAMTSLGNSKFILKQVSSSKKITDTYLRVKSTKNRTVKTNRKTLRLKLETSENTNPELLQSFIWASIWV